MWLWRIAKFTFFAVPAAALSVVGPWWLHDWLMSRNVSDIAASQLCIIVGGTMLMVGIAVAWHMAGWPLVSQRSEVPRILRERKLPAAVVILSLVVAAWGVGFGVAGVHLVEALAAWGIAGRIAAGALALFFMSVVVLAWKLTSQETVSKEEIAESTPTMLKIVAALLLAVAGYVQRTGGWIADRLRGRS